MNDNTLFYVQVIGALFLGLNLLATTIGGFWVKIRLAKQDVDRAAKNDEVKAVVTASNTAVMDAVKQAQASPVTVNVTGTVPTAEDKP